MNFYLDECENAIIRASENMAVYQWLKQHGTKVDLAKRAGAVIESIDCAKRMLQKQRAENPQNTGDCEKQIAELQLQWAFLQL